MNPIDKHRVRLSFERAAAGYDAVAVLQREIAGRLLQRLTHLKDSPKAILDLGTGTGHLIEPLARRYPRARLVAVDFAYGMLLRARRRGHWWRRPLCLCADAESLPLAAGSIDLVISNAMLQWCDPNRVFAECRRVLRPGGTLLFTTFGPDTLKELRLAWAEVDGYSHVSPFIDLHDLGDSLLRAQLTDAVMDADRLTLTYGDLSDLMHDLKGLGAHNATLDRPRGLLGRRCLEALTAAYERYRRDGLLPASFEVLYGYARVPEVQAGVQTVAVPISAVGRRSRSGP
ncbi:malonyl-ACP O-methyltransferase BioC [Caldichromatium japonicum]|uniref:Malonyl-[acyl-carrier protein] O-methyltransferase n=1 Tax=Caldichromatium japonicum TaxID=2699430 RepID=A0A6G7VC65_9GAMM|nr:malonyl-ACP O-methyltransferase BioC [Caldichromatium japonicum]QIK37649.1 malonyl-ACP O-methyltransferase BioC [Caldichromatium japonicum]